MKDSDNIRALCLVGLVGTVCALPEDGKRVNKVVQYLLNQGCCVKLDFYGVRLVTPSFYAAVTDGLYSVFPESDSGGTLSMTNLPVSFRQQRF